MRGSEAVHPVPYARLILNSDGSIFLYKLYNNDPIDLVNVLNKIGRC